MKTSENSQKGGSRRQRLLLASAILLLLLASGIWLATFYVPAPAQLQLPGSPTSMGTSQGEAQRLKLKLVIDRYLHATLCGDNQPLIDQRRQLASTLADQWPAVYQQELQALARSSGCRRDDLAYGNLFLDMGSARAGCRSLVLSETDTFLHAHNLDWSNLGGLAKWTTTLYRRQPADGRLATVAVGFPGQIGALDIINEAGVALSFNQLGLARERPEASVFLSMRRIAETCRTFDDARDALLALPPGMPFIITLSAAAEQRGAIFERRTDTIAERPLSHGWVAAANQAQGRTKGNTRLDQVLQKRPATTLAEAKAILRHPDVLAANNLYSLIFDFRANQLHLASGQLPAAAGTYRTYTLFPNHEPR